MPGTTTSRAASPKAGRAPSRGRRRAAAPVTYADRPWLASYPDGVPADVDVPDVPLTRLLDDAASAYPTSTALAFLGTRISYKDLKQAVDRFATALAGLGVGKGDRVAVVLPNCPQNVIVTYATLRLGAVVVQHNPLYTETELRHQLADCGATVVVCLDRVYETVARVRPDTAVQHVVVTSIADYLPLKDRVALRLPVKKAKRARAETVATLPKGAPVRHFTALLKSAGLPTRQVAVDPATDIALLQYTGGTSGLSKGARLTHRNLVSNAHMNRLWDTEAQPGKEVCLAVLPLFHAYGLTVCMNATLLIGGTLVLLPRFDLDLVFAAIDEHRPTLLPGVPPIYKAISDSPKARSHDLRSIRVCVSGAMKLPGEIQEQFERISGARLVEGYGLTETSPSTHCNPLVGTRKPGTIGVPLPGTQVKIVEQDDASREVPPGSPGEMAIKGPQVFAGYWGQDDLPGVFTDDGYVLTGDIAVMDDDGFFTVVDRKKELIIAGGFNIYPSEVEEVLFRHPAVADAVVVGIPDRYRGETVKAFVVRQPGSDVSDEDIVAHCAKELTAYKVPKLVEFRDALPRTVVGKVLRRVLLEQEREKVTAGRAATPASVPGGVQRGGEDGAEVQAGGVKDGGVLAAIAEPELQAEQEAVATAPAARKAAKAAAKSTAKAPAKAAKVPAKAGKAPAKAAKGPAKAGKAPAKAAKVPAKQTAEAPATTAAKAAGESAAKAPAKKAAKEPATKAAKAPAKAAKAPAKKTAKAPAKQAAKAPAKKAGKATGDTAKRDTPAVPATESVKPPARGKPTGS